MPDISNNDDMSVDLEYPSPKYAEIPLNEIYQWLCEVTFVSCFQW